MSDQVHWSEGLFLQPQHLQAMQRKLVDRFGAERRQGWPIPNGVIETRLSPDALENHSVRFTRLSAVMPSGLYVNLPEDTDLPPLNIKQTFESSPNPFVVYLGVPVWQPDRANTVGKTPPTRIGGPNGFITWPKAAVERRKQRRQPPAC